MQRLLSFRHSRRFSSGSSRSRAWLLRPHGRLSGGNSVATRWQPTGTFGVTSIDLTW